MANSAQKRGEPFRLPSLGFHFFKIVLVYHTTSSDNTKIYQLRPHYCENLLPSTSRSFCDEELPLPVPPLEPEPPAGNPNSSKTNEPWLD